MFAFHEGMVKRFLSHFVPFYGHRIMGKHLDGVWVRGLEQAREVAAQGPVMFAANHVCWWDGIVMLTLHHHLQVDGRFLIDQTSADKISWLSLMGAIGIDRSTTVSAAEGMEAAAAWLDRPQHSLWVYPQGRYRPSHIRPLGLQRGLSIVQKYSGATVIPVTMQLHYFLAHLPTCVITFGDPITSQGRPMMKELEAALLAQLDEQDAWFDGAQKGPPFTELVPTRIVPIEERWPSRVWIWLQQRYRSLKRALGIGAST